MLDDSPNVPFTRPELSNEQSQGSRLYSLDM